MFYDAGDVYGWFFRLKRISVVHLERARPFSGLPWIIHRTRTRTIAQAHATNNVGHMNVSTGLQQSFIFVARQSFGHRQMWCAPKIWPWPWPSFCMYKTTLSKCIFSFQIQTIAKIVGIYDTRRGSNLIIFEKLLISPFDSVRCRLQFLWNVSVKCSTLSFTFLHQWKGQRSNVVGELVCFWWEFESCLVGKWIGGLPDDDWIDVCQSTCELLLKSIFGRFCLFATFITYWRVFCSFNITSLVQQSIESNQANEIILCLTIIAIK